MLNPFTCQIKGDLSRADFVVLTQLCRGKDVVEYGAGGSTLLFAQIAKSVVTYETKPEWFDRVTKFLDQVPDKVCDPEVRFLEETRDGSSVKGLSQSCDVLFDDGWAMMRPAFLLEFWQDVRECAILHDTRATYAGNVLKMFLDAYEKPYDKEKWTWPPNHYLASLKSIDWNYLESNMAVLHKRNCSLYWENWNGTESENNRVKWS